MRRTLFGLLTVVAIAGLVLTSSCQRVATLRVVSINNGMTLNSDIADWMCYFNKAESSEVEAYQCNTDSVPVEMQYVEIGAGLPTWTPYEAIINQVKIKYVGSAEAGIDYSTYATAVVPLALSILADRSASKTTKFYIPVVSGTMKDAIFNTDVLPPSLDGQSSYDLLDLVTATIDFSGYDSVANQTVEAKGTLQIQFGNFYDDTTKFGK